MSDSTKAAVDRSSRNLDQSSTRHEDVTFSSSFFSPSLDVAAKGFYVGTAGNLIVYDLKGNKATFTGLVAGSTYPIAFTKLEEPSSDEASNIVALY